MNFFTATLLSIVLVVTLLFTGAYFHEGDIQRECAKTGKSGAATWRGEIVCSPVAASR